MLEQLEPLRLVCVAQGDGYQIRNQKFYDWVLEMLRRDPNDGIAHGGPFNESLVVHISPVLRGKPKGVVLVQLLKSYVQTDD